MIGIVAVFWIAQAGALETASTSAEELFVSHPVTASGAFSPGIEGPASAENGDLYVVNARESGTIGRVRAADLTKSDAKVEVMLTLPKGSIGNGIRFDSHGRMFIADYKAHNIYVVEAPGQTPRVYVHDRFDQPNDLAIARDGTLFASDPDWKHGHGRVWRVDPPRGGGAAKSSVLDGGREMGTTNGIDLSPDEHELYVTESARREIWAYRLEGGKLSHPRLVIRFPDFSLDGLRTDIEGHLYVARIDKGTIARLKPDGTVEREIHLGGKEPTNLTFGGPDGRTVFVTQKDGRRIEAFRVDARGRETKPIPESGK